MWVRCAFIFLLDILSQKRGVPADGEKRVGEAHSSPRIIRLKPVGAQVAASNNRNLLKKKKQIALHLVFNLKVTQKFLNL